MEGTQSMPITLVVNAGGASSRMGTQKALLPVPPAGKPLVVHVIEALQSLRLSGTVVVANDPAVAEAVAGPAGRGVRCVADIWPGAGPLGGIAAGLMECQGWAAVIGCDMPLVNAAVVGLLAHMAQETDAAGARRWDAVAPLIRERTQTMHALYHRDILPIIEEMIKAGELSVRTLLARVQVRYVTEAEIAGVDPAMRSFINVNTPEEWAAVQPMLRGG
jgi:molybdopterin-guanine dinucleotide biosynthesis protein A